jgi:hypothetical protein
MKLYINIKPKQIVVRNVWPKDRFHAAMRAIDRYITTRYCLTSGSRGGMNFSGWTDLTNTTIYAYNVEYRKRGKYKNDKHFVVNVYSINLEVLKVLGLSIEQKRYNFKLYKTDRNGRKIYL